jgi:hypothetical protein
MVLPGLLAKDRAPAADYPRPIATDDEALLEAAPADDEPLTAEDLTAIREGLAEYRHGVTHARLDRGHALYSSRALRDQGRLGRPMYERVGTALVGLPQGDLRRLVGAEPATFRLRVSDERVLFVQPEAGVLLVVRVMHRSTAY